MSNIYYTLLKTTDSELKAYENLNLEVKKNIMPIFELTKSRMSSNNTNMSIYKRIDKIKELIKDRQFILDLTVEKQLENDQIKTILRNSEGGYPLWIQLIKDIKESEKYKLNVIPVIHYNPYVVKDVLLEIEELKKIKGTQKLALRVELDDALNYMNNIKNKIEPKDLILILDGGYFDIRFQNSNTIFVKYKNIIDKIKYEFHENLPQILCCFSTFPDSVVKYYGCKDDCGNFERTEKDVFQKIKNEYINMPSNKIIYSDYASVHPFRYNISGLQWIPRIDFLDDNKMYYCRRRRELGGYVECAKDVIGSGLYKKIREIDTWGDEEIYKAYQNNPTAKAPSHWISVRINLYITKIYLEQKHS
jgi:hypothetical protein